MKNNNHGFTLKELLIVGAVLLQISFIGLIIFVAIHFIKKLW